MMKNNIKNKLVIIDNGHGEDTPGKRSPDGTFREYLWCREFAKLLKYELEEWDYNVIILTPENHDISISARINRANKLCEQYGTSNCILVSIHNNAAGSGDKWYNATGFEVFTSPGKTKSDTLAEYLYQEIEKEGITIRTDLSDNDMDKEASFGIIVKTRCPAILTENMFMDSEKDLEFLNSEDGIQKLLKAHVCAIRRYFEDYGGTYDSWLNENLSWDNYWFNKKKKKYDNRTCKCI